MGLCNLLDGRGGGGTALVLPDGGGGGGKLFFMEILILDGGGGEDFLSELVLFIVERCTLGVGSTLPELVLSHLGLRIT